MNAVHQELKASMSLYGNTEAGDLLWVSCLADSEETR